jgi:hypothetical protein
MKINKKLHLVVPVEVDEVAGEVVSRYFHSAPIMYETFQKYHFVICATLTKLLSAGMEVTGPKIAAMTLEEVARDMGKWEGAEGVENGLMNEIARLTNVLALDETGWKTYPVGIAVDRGLIDEDEWREAKQRIVFFTLVFVMTKGKVRNDLLEILNDSWQTRTVSFNCTEYAASLPMLTREEITPPNLSQVAC